MKGKGRFDYVLLVVVLALMGFGIVMVYSTSAILAGDRFQDPSYFLKRQAFYAGIGLALMIVMIFFPYRVLNRFAYPILIWQCFGPDRGPDPRDRGAGGRVDAVAEDLFVYLSAFGICQAGTGHLSRLLSDQEGGEDPEFLFRISAHRPDLRSRHCPGLEGARFWNGLLSHGHGLSFFSSSAAHG